MSLTTPALSVAESVHDTIKKADSVKDDRLKVLIVGKEVSDLTKNGKDSVLNQTKDGLKDGFNADDFTLNISIKAKSQKLNPAALQLLRRAAQSKPTAMSISPQLKKISTSKAVMSAAKMSVLQPKAMSILHPAKIQIRPVQTPKPAAAV